MPDHLPDPHDGDSVVRARDLIALDDALIRAADALDAVEVVAAAVDQAAAQPHEVVPSNALMAAVRALRAELDAARARAVLG